MSYLFGDILLISRRDLWLWSAWTCWWPAGADFLPQVHGRLLRPGVCRAPRRAGEVYLLAAAVPDRFDRRAAGRVVGIVMVVALLTLPAAVAGFSPASCGR